MEYLKIAIGIIVQKISSCSLVVSEIATVIHKG